MLTQEQVKEIADKVGAEAAGKIQADFIAAENRINTKMTDVTKGLMKQEDFDKFKSDEIAKVNEKLLALEKMENAVKEQGTKLEELLLKQTKDSGKKTIEEFIEGLGPQIKTLQEGGTFDGKKFLSFTAKQLKDAGVTSIGSSVLPLQNGPANPWMPGIGGAELEIFDIMRNPNFITSRVDLGRTNLSYLAWANEKEYLGAPAEVEEGGKKPITQHKFEVEFSKAKKIAAYIELTDEFDQDLPGLGTKVRRMLQEDVERGFDDAIQLAVIAVAQSFGKTGLNGMIEDPDFWISVYAMLAQIKHDNFIPNTVGISPLTDVALQGQKDDGGAYLMPPFAGEINRLTVQANKLEAGKVLVGDLKQFKVDIYKDFMLKVGYINEQLIENKLTVVGEMRYHRYISDARKKAIVYDTLDRVKTVIDSVSS